MAVAFDTATVSGDMANLTSKSWSHTCNGNDGFLLVGLAGWGGVDNNLSAVVVKYNDVTMTKLGGNQASNDNNTVFWGLINPASGANTVAVTNIPASYDQLGGGSVSFTGVHQTTATDTVVNGAAADTVNVPSVVSGDLVADIYYNGDGDNPTPTAGGTKRISQQSDGFPFMIMSTRGGSGTVTTGYPASTDKAISGVRIIQSSSVTFSGTLLSGVATLAGVQSVIGSFNGALLSTISVLAGVLTVPTAFSGNLASVASTMAGVLSVPVLFSGVLSSPRSSIAGILSVVPFPADFMGALRGQASHLNGVFGLIPTPERLSNVRIRFTNDPRRKYHIYMGPRR